MGVICSEVQSPACLWSLKDVVPLVNVSLKFSMVPEIIMQLLWVWPISHALFVNMRWLEVSSRLWWLEQKYRSDKDVTTTFIHRADMDFSLFLLKECLNICLAYFWQRGLNILSFSASYYKLIFSEMALVTQTQRLNFLSFFFFFFVTNLFSL